jgi:microcystin-dependent protein
MNSSAITTYSFAPTIGDIKMSTVLQDHEGWLICNGRSLDTSEFSQLFGVIGYTFGGSGRLFTLPDGRGRVAGAIGPDGNNVGGDISWSQGDRWGTQRETIDICEMPSHSHDICDLGHTHSQQVPSGSIPIENDTPDTNGLVGSSTINTGSSTTGIVIENTGGDVPINIMQPTIFIGNMYIYSGRRQLTISGIPPSHRVQYY